MRISFFWNEDLVRVGGSSFCLTELSLLFFLLFLLDLVLEEQDSLCDRQYGRRLSKLLSFSSSYLLGLLLKLLHVHECILIALNSDCLSWLGSTLP
jgi:hypothetical protein